MAGKICICLWRRVLIRFAVLCWCDMMVANKTLNGSSNTTEHMKKLFLAVLAAGALMSAQAQLFTPESTTGAWLGGIVGGVIGHNSGHHTGEGIAIGAASGLLLGSIAHEVNSDRYSYGGYSGYGGYGGYYGYPSYGYSVYPAYYSYPRYGYRRPYWRGGWGVGFSGYYSPAYAYGAPSYSSAPSYYASAPAPAPAQQSDSAPAPQPATYNSGNSSTPMSGANSLFGR
ncbi:MAG: hypothetical protein JWR26_89 [Pedosphaera sp.]|nr:hypothetical protein [Pedosphaera sp.]